MQDTRNILAVPTLGSALLWVCCCQTLLCLQLGFDLKYLRRECLAAGLDFGSFFPNLKHSMVPALLQGMCCAHGGGGWVWIGVSCPPHPWLPAAAELLLGCLSSHQSITCNTWGSVQLKGAIFPCSTSAQPNNLLLESLRWHTGTGTCHLGRPLPRVWLCCFFPSLFLLCAFFPQWDGRGWSSGGALNGTKHSPKQPRGQLLCQPLGIFAVLCHRWSPALSFPTGERGRLWDG